MKSRRKVAFFLEERFSRLELTLQIIDSSIETKTFSAPHYRVTALKVFLSAFFAKIRNSLKASN